MNPTFQSLFERTVNHLTAKNYLLNLSDTKPITQKALAKASSEKPQTVPSKIVVLAFAFNMAFENYKSIRKNNQTLSPLKLSEVSEMLVRFFSNKYYKKIETLKNESFFFDDSLNYEIQSIEEFRKVEYKLFGIVKRLRNYHSHYFHEPGVLTFEDLFKTEKCLSESDFQEAAAWFEKRFTDAQNHLLESLVAKKVKLETADDNAQQAKLTELENVINGLKQMTLHKSSQLTPEGQLFIACLFLYKRQAKMVLEKWPELIRPDGFENTLHTFFTYYCLSERYSLNNYSDDLFKFREITAQLTSIAYDTNPQMEFIYTKIRELNEPAYLEHEQKVSHKIEELTQKLTPLIEEKKKYRKNIPDKLKNEISDLKKQLKSIRKDIKSKAIPIRKREVMTPVLLRYLLDNDLLDLTKWKIAIKKTLTDRIEYYAQHSDVLDSKDSLTTLKNKIKEETDLTKRNILKQHLKELKRNFRFTNNKVLLDSSNFTLKRKNALLQYTHNNTTINVTVSPDLLMKCVFIDLQVPVENKDEKNKNNGIKKIESFLIGHISRYNLPDLTIERLRAQFVQNNQYSSQFLPKSITKQIQPPTIQQIQEHITNRIKKLEQFAHTNSLQPKPWKFAAKKKIDVILEFMHFCLLSEVYTAPAFAQDTEHQKTNYIRHNAFSIDMYDIAREYFRYFGRYRLNRLDSDLITYQYTAIEALKNKYQAYFSFIASIEKHSTSLEELFDGVQHQYISKLEELRQNNYSSELLAKILKITKPANNAHIQPMLKTYFLTNVCLGPEIISLKEVFPTAWEQLRAEKSTQPNFKEFHCSDFTLIRHQLANNDPAIKTNADFILKVILPQCQLTTPKIPNKVFHTLLQLKSEELVLWNVAKHYWKRATRNNYTLLESNKNTSQDFWEYTMFNKAYNQNLRYKFGLGPASSWTEKKQKKFASVLKNNPLLKDQALNVDIEIPARRYDNKFLGAESQLIEEYLLWNHVNDNKDCLSPEQHNYDSLIEGIYKELNKSISYICLVLANEKKLIDSQMEDFKGAVFNRYGGASTLVDFYLPFDNKTLVEAFNELLKKTKSNEPHESIDYLNSFRNFALHYQLQDPHHAPKLAASLDRILNPKPQPKTKYHPSKYQKENFQKGRK